MAVNQYIGAAYVAHGWTTWNAQTSYDNMYVVEYQNGNYISKKNVPAGNAPAGNQVDNEYWAFFGVKSTQIELYRQEIENYQENINDFVIPAINVGLTNTRILCVGDSYGWVDGNWANYILQFIPGTNVSANGAGFIRTPSFISLIQNVNDLNTYTHCIIAGGYNDNTSAITENACYEALSNIVSILHSKNPTMKIYLSMIGANMTDNIKNNLNTTAYSYSRAAYRAGVTYLDVGALLFNQSYMIDDLKHPNTLGGQYLGRCLIGGIFYGDITTPVLFSYTFNATEGTGNASYYVFQNKFFKTLLMEDLEITFDGNKVLSYNSLLNLGPLQGVYSNSSYYPSAKTAILANNETFICEIQIRQNNLWVRPIITSTLTTSSIKIARFQINGQPWYL